MTSPVNIQALQRVVSRYTSNAAMTLAVLHQPEQTYAPFAMATSSQTETVCEFSTSISFPIRLNGRVTLGGFFGTDFSTDMFLIPVAGQPNQFMLSLTIDGPPVSVNGQLPGSADIEEKRLSANWDLATLLRYEVASLAKQTAPFAGSESVVNSVAMRDTTSVNFTNSLSSVVPVSHILTIDNYTQAMTLADAYYLEPTVTPSLATGDTLTVKARFEARSAY